MRLALALASLVFASCAASPAEDPPQDRWLTFHDQEGPGRKKLIVWIAADDRFRSEESLPMLAHLMAKRHGFDCTVLFAQDPETGFVDPGNRNYIVGLEWLDEADLVVICARDREWPAEEMEHLDAYLRSGRPVIGIRTAIRAFESESDSDSPYAHYSWDGEDPAGGFGRVVLGSTWVGTLGVQGEQSTRAVPIADASDHPILRGVETIHAESALFDVEPLPDDATVLMTGVAVNVPDDDGAPMQVDDDAPSAAVAWTREGTLKSGAVMRVVVTTLGSGRDLQDESLRRLIVNSCYWALRMEDSIPELSDARPMEWYSPSPTGIGRGFRTLHPTEMRPASRGVHRW